MKIFLNKKIHAFFMHTTTLKARLDFVLKNEAKVEANQFSPRLDKFLIVCSGNFPFLLVATRQFSSWAETRSQNRFTPYSV